MTKSKQLILDYLRTTDWVTASDIAEATGLPKQETEAHLEKLHEEGEIDYYRSGYPLKWGIAE